MLAHVAAWIAILLATSIVLAVAVRTPRVSALILVAFALRLSMALVHAYVAPLPGSTDDAVTFLRHAEEWAAEGFVHALTNIRSGSRVYPSLLSVVFAVTGASELLAQAINVLFGTLTVLNVWRLTLFVAGNEVAARRAGWVAALFPSMVLFSALTLREVAVVYPFTLALVQLARWHREDQPLRFLAALMLLAVSSAFHSGMVVTIPAAGLLLLARGVHSVLAVRGESVIRQGAAAVGLLVLLTGVVGTGVGLEKFGGSVENLSTELIADRQENAARSRAAYLQGEPPSSLSQLVLQIPVRVVYFFFTPFAWMVRTGSDVVGFVDTLFYLTAAFGIVRARHALWADRMTRAMLIVLITVTLPFAVSTSNYGTALRHRAKLAPLVFCLAAAAALRRAARHDVPATHRVALAQVP